MAWPESSTKVEGRVIATQPVRSRGGPFIQGAIALLGECSVQLLALLCEFRVQVLGLLFECLFSVAAGSVNAVELRKHGASQGEDADAASDERSFNSRTHNRNLIQLPALGTAAAAVMAAVRLRLVRRCVSHRHAPGLGAVHCQMPAAAALPVPGPNGRAVAPCEGHKHPAGCPQVPVLALFRVVPPGKPPHSHLHD